MAQRTDLDAAAAAGIIGAEQVQPLHDFLAARVSAPAKIAALPGEEDLRFIRNFHDVFLAIGIILFAVGLAIGIGTYVALEALVGDERSRALIVDPAMFEQGASGSEGNFRLELVGETFCEWEDEQQWFSESTGQPFAGVASGRAAFADLEV
mgnify:CR=1 FL=1